MNKRSVLTIIALLVIASMVLSACGGAQATTPAPAEATDVPVVAKEPTNPPAAEKVVLNIMHNWGPDDAKGAPLQSIFADFMKANPGITIKDQVFVDADIPLKVETASAAKQEPDLVFVQRVGSPLSWTDSGIALPVNDLMKEWGLDGKFKAEALSQYTQADGKLQAFPLEGGFWPIWYNTKILKAAGVEIPQTTEQLVAAAAKIRAAGYGPVVASGKDGMGSYLFFLTVQTMMTDEETAKSFGGGDFSFDAARKGIELFTQLRDAKVFVDGVEGIDYATGNTLFYTGKVAISHFGAWAFGEAPKEELADITLGGWPIPTGSPHKAPILYSAYTGKGIWITPNGAAKMDAVKKFVQFIYQPDMMARFVEQAGMTPPLKDVPVDKSKLNPLFVQSLSLPAEVVMIPDLVVPAKVQPLLERVTQVAFTMGTTPDKIIEDLTNLYKENK